MYVNSGWSAPEVYAALQTVRVDSVPIHETIHGAKARELLRGAIAGQLPVGYEYATPAP